MLVESPAIKEHVPAVRSEWEKKPEGAARLDLTLLLAKAYLKIEDGEHLKEMASEILKQYPESYTAIGLAGGGFELLKDFNAWRQMLDAQLAKHPDDEHLLRLKSYFADVQNDFAGDRAELQKIFDLGKATANDYNAYAWTGLFDNKIDDEIINAARQATMLTKNSSFGELHTLACLYAQQGKTTEARDLLLKAMTVSNLSVPNSEVWFGFGSIYEQYGAYDAAKAAYSKVEKPFGRVNVGSTWLLAQSRLQGLSTKRQ